MAKRLIVPVAICLVALAILPAAASVGPPASAFAAAPSESATTSHRLIVELDAPPLAVWAAKASPGEAVSAAGTRGPDGRLDVSSPPAVAYVQRLERQQQAFSRVLRQAVPGARVASYRDENGALQPLTYQIVFNGVVVDAGRAADLNAVAERLATLPGVKQVYRDYAHEPSLYASLPLINAAAAWNALGGRENAGAGVKIASLDTGVHHQAPMFDPTGFSYPPGYPLGYRENTNGKIIVSRAYFRDWDPPVPGDDTPWPGPNGSSHGVHTSSTAAGVPVTADYYGQEVELSGVAPRAYVMSYRAFYPSVNGRGSMYSAEGIAALEDIVRDGADVVNNSWGSGPDSRGGPGDPLDQALVNAWRAGVFVVVSNGNSGPAPGTGDHPSNEYVNVGGVTTSGTFRRNFVSVTAPEPVPEELKMKRFIPASFGGSLPPAQVFGPSQYLPAAAVDPDNFEGCQPWPEGTFDGRIAVISRGSCQFGLKALQAEQAGATLVIIYNHATGGDALVTMAPGEVGDQVTIPALFIGHSAGVAIVDWYSQYPDEAQLEVSTKAIQVGNTPDRMYTASSRGPSAAGTLKPDLAAPAVNILAQGYGPGTGEQVHFGYGQASGTSMAAPHVSGAAALVKQLHPDWSNDWIKSALMTTAKYLEIYNPDGSPAQPLDIGAGRLDLTKVADPGVILDPPKLSFGTVVSGTTASITVQVTGVADTEEQYQLETVFTGDGFDDLKPVPGLGVNMRSITVAPGQTVSFEVTWDTTLAGGIGDHQGYVVLSGTEHQAHLPAWIRIAPPPAEAEVLIIDNDGSSVPTETLAAIGITEPFPDYTSAYTTTLHNLRYRYDVWDADAHGGGGRYTIPHPAYLQQYEAVIYQTGDYWVPDGSTPGYTAPTAYDLARLVEYINAGGRLIVFGQDFSSTVGASPSGAPFFYAWNLGSRFIQDSVTGSEVYTTTPQILSGMPETPFASLTLDLSGRGDGAGNQAFIDEVDYEEGQFAPFKFAMAGSVQEDGFVATSKRDDPTLERPETTFAGRTLHFAFGLEGVNNDTGYSSREDLLFTALAWVLDEATVEITHTLAAANRVSYFQAEMTSTYGQEVTGLRWDFGDGTPPLEEIGTPTGQWGHLYRQPGHYTVRVEAVNELGTRAVAATEVVIPAGPEHIDRWRVIYLPQLVHGLLEEAASP